jgi:hypothetical protein
MHAGVQQRCLGMNPGSIAAEESIDMANFGSSLQHHTTQPRPHFSLTRVYQRCDVYDCFAPLNIDHCSCDICLVP